MYLQIVVTIWSKLMARKYWKEIFYIVVVNHYQF